MSAPFPFRSPRNFRPTTSGSTAIVQRTITSKARLTAQALQTITSKASLGGQTLKPITSKARLTAVQRQTITSVARLTKADLSTILSQARLTRATLQTITSKARLVAQSLKTVTSKARLTRQTLQSITSKARLGPPNLGVYPAGTPGMTAQYGSFKLDESNGCILSSEYDALDTPTDGMFYMEFRCRLTPGTETGDTAVDDAAFQSLISNLETQLRIPRQRLIVKFGTTAPAFRDWNFNTVGVATTAIVIRPELRLIRENRGDFYYGLRIRCQFPGNVPGNAFRRESVTRIGASLRERRTCTIQAVWTATTGGGSAYGQYLAAGDAFYNSYLPMNTVDQYGNAGSWVRADEDPHFNDENSVLTATRTYWEVFAGRRDSAVKTITVINGLRTCVIPGVWTSTPGFTALQNYTNNAGQFFLAALPAFAANDSTSSWVLVDEEPSFNDANDILTVTRTYHETQSNGLRELNVHVYTIADQTRVMEVSGAYYSTPQANAATNYKNGIVGVIQAQLVINGITKSESKSVPKEEGYDITRMRYFFKWTLKELAFQQTTLGYDDPNITVESLNLRLSRPFDPQSQTTANKVTRLQVGTALFVASIDTTSANGLDPVRLWDQRFRASAVANLQTRLRGGGAAVTVQVIDEEVSHTDQGNQLSCKLTIVVTGGKVLSLHMSQTIMQKPGMELDGMGDGTPFSYQGYHGLPEMIMHREAECEYLLGFAPVLFGVGDVNVSGFAFVDTGRLAQDDVTQQNTIGTPVYAPASLPGWMIDGRAPAPFLIKNIPTDSTDGTFQRVRMMQAETWRYVVQLKVSPL